jgi:hypothetical protein
MRSHFTAIGLVLGLGVGSSACSDFLTGPKLGENPNRPTTASRANLLVSGLTNLTFQSEGHMARTICVWMQQCAGTSKQYQALGSYIVGDDEHFTDWSDAYVRGGLLDLRRMQKLARTPGDSGYAGVGLVIEAWLIGQTADVWGDIPYSQAADSTIAAPKLDPQQEVYAAVQAKLDTAIVFLSATNAATTAPGGEDVVYGGNVAKWNALVHTLKARYYLHTAERVGLPAYQAALAAATNGITDATGAGDYLTFHGSSVTESNIWHQFHVGWPQYLSAGRFLVDTLKGLPGLDTLPGFPGPEPRLSQYFAPNSSGLFVGADPGQSVAGDPSELSAVRLAASFRQPLVTYAENQLILAEASWQVAGGGPAGNAAAQPFVTAERAALGLRPRTVTSLADIMVEKYIVLFQNPEVWNDYKRTCVPALTPASGSSSIPARLVYPLSERNANPSIPNAGPQRNWNDVNGC